MKKIIFQNLEVITRDKTTNIEGTFELFDGATYDDVTTIIEGILREVSASRNNFGSEQISFNDNQVSGYIKAL